MSFFWTRQTFWAVSEETSEFLASSEETWWLNLFSLALFSSEWLHLPSWFGILFCICCEVRIRHPDGSPKPPWFNFEKCCLSCRTAFWTETDGRQNLNSVHIPGLLFPIRSSLWKEPSPSLISEAAHFCFLSLCIFSVISDSAFHQNWAFYTVNSRVCCVRTAGRVS